MFAQESIGLFESVFVDASGEFVLVVGHFHCSVFFGFDEHLVDYVALGVYHLFVVVDQLAHSLHAVVLSLLYFTLGVVAHLYGLLEFLDVAIQLDQSLLTPVLRQPEGLLAEYIQIEIAVVIPVETSLVPQGFLLEFEHRVELPIHI